MPGYIEQLGMQLGGQAASGVLGQVMGQMFGKQNDKRQLEQQQHLQDMQIAGQKQMSDYNYQKNLEMWNATNYEATKKHMKAAGLNPALMYGMGGGGGSTTANVPQGNVSSGEAPRGGKENIDIMGMGIQMQLLKAQKDVLESQADKNRAEAAATAGVQTDVGRQNIEESKTRVDSLLQGIDNQRNQYELQRLEMTMKNIENYEKQASQEDRLDYIEYQTQTAAKNLNIIGNEQKISDATIKDKITIIRQAAIASILQNELTKGGITKQGQEIINLRKDFEVKAGQLAIQWEELGIDKRRQALESMMTDYKTDDFKNAMDNIMRAIDNIFVITTARAKPRPIYDSNRLH